ncbi:MAG: hypothetical protein JSU77_12800 [Fidelibacterota bacterium]|nr:MAG: hypothetical protein JSU77_12800 [Candidatus Neomarinimicrobiota bacterium]
MIRSGMFLLCLVLLAGGCRDAGTPSEVELKTNELAQRYAKLVLAMEHHDPGYVDAYYGPAEWRTEVEESPWLLEDALQEADSLLLLLSRITPDKDELSQLRHTYLNGQIQAVRFRAELLSGKSASFDQESQGLYGATAPRHSAAYYDSVLEELDNLLPGSGTIPDRYRAYQTQFEIPPERLPEVLDSVVADSRNRTGKYLRLPAGETFELEFVTDKPWSGYNWYKGNSISLIQINTDQPSRIDRVLDLACHEGYPGHHVYHSLFESELYSKRGWVEYCVYPLYSPQSLIAEGTANAGIDLVFPSDARSKYEQEVLYPLAGLDPSLAADYLRVQEIRRKLRYARVDAARALLDGAMSEDETIAWLMKYSLYTDSRARQSVAFFRTYRSYIINYSLGQDLVEAWLDRQSGDSPARRWNAFEKLLTSPYTPGGL